MSDAIKSASATVWAWRLIIFKCFNNWFTVVAMALFAQDFAWSSMTPSQRARLIVMALVAGAKAIEAFLNQDLGQMKAKLAADLSDQRITVQAAPTPQIAMAPAPPASPTP